MALEIGSRIAHYDVTALIGEGGMGQVYQATDTKLGRQVALKILPEAFATDPDRLARFQREAQVLASLNHPGIAAIYGIEEQDDTRALVLELVEGPTLADRISKGPIPIDEALPIAKQIAEALEAAHEAGVIHRDLKPANVKVREDGTVKVLDFGLAKAFQPDASDVSASMSPTISLTAAATQMGMVIGTAAYMAPEQARGKQVDRRADIFAFGVVLYEMLTGQRPFQGEDVSLTLAAVMTFEPDFDRLPETLSPTLKTYLIRCLAKDSKERVRDIGDVRLALAGGFDVPTTLTESGGVVPQLQVWQRPLPLFLGVVVLVSVTGIAAWSLTQPGPERLQRFVITTPPDGPLVPGGAYPDVAISPDGTRIVYLSSTGGRGGRQLFVRTLDEFTAAPLRGTERGSLAFFSPDGESVGFHDFQGELLKRVSVLGGPAVTICALGGQPRGMSWATDGTIVFATHASRGLLRVPDVGGEPEVLTTVDPEQEETDHYWPEVLPNGKGVLFTAWSGSDETSRLAVVSLETSEITYLLTGGSNPHYSPTGHIVYSGDGTLWAVGFDADRFELTTNNPVAVVENMNTKAAGAGNFGLADTGSLVYVSGDAQARGGGIPVWVDREGREEPVELTVRPYFWPRLSPDGTRLAVGIFDQENMDVWLSDLARGTLSRLTTDAGSDGNPLWTPDGERVVFASDRDGAWALFWKDPDGTEEPEHLVTVEEATGLRPYAWSPDAEILAFTYQTPGTRSDIGVLTMTGERAWEPLMQTEVNESNPTISPDGDWVAYSSDESGTFEVYVQRFPGLGERQQMSTGGGSQPLWSPDGRELFYLRPNQMMGVSVEPGETLGVGNAEVLFQGMQQYLFRPGRRNYDISPDGERFLMIKSGATTDETSALAQMILVQNWFEELNRLVPTN